MNNDMDEINLKKDVTMLVCCHKEDFYYDGNGFFPIHVGKALHSDVKLNMIGDDTGDNISALNHNFCELTAMYWYWKNGHRTKYVGLSHYRRYFYFGIKLPFGIYSLNKTVKDIRLAPPILPDLDTIFKNYDVVLPVPNRYPYPLIMDYSMCHIREDIEILGKVIEDIYPEYLKSFNVVMRKKCKLSHYNMFISTNDFFENYSTWLFSILFEVSKRIVISGYEFQARVYGFMAERLMNVYVFHNKLKVKYVPVIKITDEPNNMGFRTGLRCLRDIITGWLLKNHD